jgi:hypothetical protein
MSSLLAAMLTPVGAPRAIDSVMKNNALRAIALGFGFSAASLLAQVQAGAVFSGDGLRSFYFAVGNYYHVPEREVAVVYERAIPPEEVPVVFYVAQRVRVEATVIADLRRRGVSWADIAIRYHQTPDIYYFRGGPPYGKAYGYWKKHPPRDVEVIDAVNVHFLSEYHHVGPDVVWTERSKKGGYVAVARDFDDRRDGDDRGKGKGKGHGKGHDR